MTAEPAKKASLSLEWFPGEYMVWRRPPNEQGPRDAFAILRTPEETTVVTTEPDAPEGTRVSGPWRLFRIADELPHDAVGIMAALSAALAKGGVPILPFGSFDTDYVLVPLSDERKARAALSAAGYSHE